MTDATNDATSEALRAAALATIGAHADERVAQIAREAALSIEHGVSEWEASTGRVVAHRVYVGLSAPLLGALRGHPHVEDEVTRILSVAMAKSHGDRVSEIFFHHDPHAAPHAVETPYRGSLAPLDAPAPARTSVSDNVSSYLVAYGDEAVAAIARRAEYAVTIREPPGKSELRIRVTLAREDASAAGDRLELLEKCVCDLFQHGSEGDVRCEIVRKRR
jgi:hypothetical protein